MYSIFFQYLHSFTVVLVAIILLIGGFTIESSLHKFIKSNIIFKPLTPTPTHNQNHSTGVRSLPICTGVYPFAAEQRPQSQIYNEKSNYNNNYFSQIV